MFGRGGESRGNETVAESYIIRIRVVAVPYYRRMSYMIIVKEKWKKITHFYRGYQWGVSVRGGEMKKKRKRVTKTS